MNFKPKISEIKSDFSVLKHQISLTSENWNDPVQKKYYKQFLDSLPKEFNNYIKSLEELDITFELAEKIIENLKNNK